MSKGRFFCHEECPHATLFVAEGHSSWQKNRPFDTVAKESSPRHNTVVFLLALYKSSSIRSSRLYLATLSLLQGAPVLICPAFTATARSAIKVSSVSPER